MVAPGTAGRGINKVVYSSCEERNRNEAPEPDQARQQKSAENRCLVCGMVLEPAIQINDEKWLPPLPCSFQLNPPDPTISGKSPTRVETRAALEEENPNSKESDWLRQTINRSHP